MTGGRRTGAGATEDGDVGELSLGEQMAKASEQLLP
jgi:hypothetical protein